MRVSILYLALCPAPVVPDNGTVTFSSLSVGAVALYSCDAELELFGDLEAECVQINDSVAQFSPSTPPNCSGILLMD